MTTNNKRSKPSKKRNGTYAIYTRKTTCYGMGDEFSNNDAQRMACETIINSKHEFVVLAKRYDDTEVDVESLDRPALAKLFNDIKRKEVDTVVVHSIGILSTDFQVIDKIMKFFNEHNVRVILAKEGIDSSTPNGRRFFQNVVDLINLENIAEEWKNRKTYEEEKEQDEWNI